MIPVHRISRLFLFAAIAVLVSGCGGDRSGSLSDVAVSGDAAGYNVLLVTLDTVRQDRLGCYGYAEAETPALDSLTRHGIRYDDAVAPAPLTLPSHASILTGLDLLGHGVRDNGRYVLGEEHPTLAEDLRAQGYDTAAFISAFVMDERYGLARGFDVYDFAPSVAGYNPRMSEFNERNAREVTDATLEWLRDRRTGEAANEARPFFAWVHYFDAHLPYASPLESLVRFRGRGYDAEIAFVDQQLQRLLDELMTTGRLDRTLIVVAADHGESLGEHGEDTHGWFVYNSTVRIPLIISCPSIFDGPVENRDDLVGLVDIRATIGDLLGVAPATRTDGQSLLHPVPSGRRLYIETENPLNLAGCSPLHSLQTHLEKYVLAPVPEYYDLTDDPGEMHNLHAERAAEAAVLHAELTTRLGRESDTVAEHQISEEERMRLESLGYVHTGGKRDGDALPDPKAMIRTFSLGMKAEELYFAGDYETAGELARQVVAGCELCLAAVRVAAFSDLRLGREEQAVALLRETVDRTQDIFMVRSLAQALIISGDHGGALETLELFHELDPADGWVGILRGDCYKALGDPDEALRQYEEALRVDENRIGIRARGRIGDIRGR